MINTTDNFAKKSKSWDMSSKRVQNAKTISNLIIQKVELKSSMEIMDFGAGTGLLSYFISSHISKIIAVDNSPAMLIEFDKKSDEFNCKTEIIESDLSKNIINRKFDGIVSSMTIHHLENIEALFTKFYNMLNKNGFIAIADLDIEDGTFHSDNIGVFHYGFDRDILQKIAIKVGFKNISFQLASVIHKPHRSFEIFLMIAER